MLPSSLKQLRLPAAGRSLRHALAARAYHILAPRPLQIDAELYFITQKLLVPIYQPKYWIGLNSTASTHPTFKWVDGYSPGPDGYTGAYTNWGASTSTTAKQPDNKDHLCGTANYLMAKTLNKTIALQWGWDDEPCNASRASMCWRPPREQAGGAGAVGYREPAVDALGAIHQHWPAAMLVTHARPTAAAPNVWIYTSNTTKATYFWSTHKKNFTEAIAHCNTLGGQLAAWLSAAEQVNAVEGIRHEQPKRSTSDEGIHTASTALKVL